MDYAIKTLEIELHLCIQSLRVIERYSVYPEYHHGDKEDWNNKIDELKRAIEILKKD